jgi:hypothetical protein
VDQSLKDEGIYIWLDMHVQRPFTANDNIETSRNCPRRTVALT